jgi:predicted HTH domain antitoxin
MNVVVSIPDKFVPAPDTDISREMLEAFAIESYRREKLSLGQIAELLGFSIDEANAFLKGHAVPLNYSLDDLDEDERAVELFLEQ